MFSQNLQNLSRFTPQYGKDGFGYPLTEIAYYLLIRVYLFN